MKNIGKILKHSAISHSTSMRNPRHSMYTDCKKKGKNKVTDEKTRNTQEYQRFPMISGKTNEIQHPFPLTAFFSFS